MRDSSKGIRQKKRRGGGGDRGGGRGGGEGRGGGRDLSNRTSMLGRRSSQEAPNLASEVTAAVRGERKRERQTDRDQHISHCHSRFNTSHFRFQNFCTGGNSHYPNTSGLLSHKHFGHKTLECPKLFKFIVQLYTKTTWNLQPDNDLFIKKLT